MLDTKKRLTAATGSLVVGSLLMAGTALAYQPAAVGHGMQMARGERLRATDEQHLPITGPNLLGTVTAITGNTITVAGGQRGPKNSTSTYTVDAAHATIIKDQATSSVGSIGMGDHVLVQGTINGTRVVATKIIEGAPTRPSRGPHDVDFERNGKPMVGGTVTNISGTTLTLTNRSNMTYVVDTKNALFNRDHATSSLPEVKVGDRVLIQGIVNGADVTASMVIDRGASQTTQKTSRYNAHGDEYGGQESGHQGGLAHVFGSLGGFFRQLFRFL